MENFLAKAKAASRVVAQLRGEVKNRILHDVADALEAKSDAIIAENAQDMEAGKRDGLSLAMLDRLLLDNKRIHAMAQALREIASLKEPVGRVLDGWVTDHGLRIEKVSVPIGVVAIIYESRPNVTSDAAALCLKSGNVALLKGGKEAERSNRIIAQIFQDILVRHGLPAEAVSLFPDTSREGVARLIKMDRYIDLVIPRGGEALIRFVNEHATMPVVKHDKGLCHLYIDRYANQEMALSIAVNAKCQRPGVCNAMETLLVDEAIAVQLMPRIKELFDAQGTVMVGCAKSAAMLGIKEASEEDFHTEWLDNKMSIRIVNGVDEAIAHISRYGSGHSEAIITENYSHAQRFLDGVDAACVYVNASTRFTDGGEFGFGAEVGISTNKLHARGPMGINDLTTYKYKIYGNGQTRA
ncbi:MAG: glutamate-5-semialdehyde dehydrogenase [Campylobacterales bacterium]